MREDSKITWECAGVAAATFYCQLDAAERIARLIPLIEGRGACRHPDGATQLAASAVTAFGRDAHTHDVEGPCFAVRRPPLLPVPGEAGAW